MAIRASDRASSTGRLRLTFDDAGLDGQLLDRGRHEREAVGEIMAVSGELPNATAAPHGVGLGHSGGSRCFRTASAPGQTRHNHCVRAMFAFNFESGSSSTTTTSGFMRVLLT